MYLQKFGHNIFSAFKLKV